MTESLPLTPEILVPRIGDVLVESGLITNDQLKKGLKRQEDLKDKGQIIPFGQLLVEMGFIDRASLDEAVTEQILALRAALQEANYNLECRVRERTAELQDALKKLAELNHLKSNFVSNISHELRTPLTHIRGYLDLLATNDLGQITPEQAEAFKVMIRSSDRLEHLIEDLILFSTASKGEVTIQWSKFNLAEVCKVAYQRALPKAAEKKVRLLFVNDPENTIIKADEEKILWILMQLLDNAIKFTSADKTVELSVSAEDEVVRIAVRDEGIGIPEDRLEEIYEPFHQLDGSSTRRYGGTGLGLALVRQIIEAHGSTIQVTSTVDKGSTFEFGLLRAQSKGDQ